MSIEIKRSDKYVDYNISATNNRGYITIDTSDWINKPWMFYELPALKFEIYTETEGELVKYQNFSREIRTYNPVYSPLGVLNVTIDIRNVPEEFILRITPIFDNDAIAARNMLIENGIENGDVWGSDQDVPTQLFNLDLEFIECEGEYVPPTPPVPPTHEETITGIPPITFDGSKGEPLVSWTILGNGEQTGTPSPDNIIMPTFCGVRTGNLFDGRMEHGNINASGNDDGTSVGYLRTVGMIEIDSTKWYTFYFYGEKKFTQFYTLEYDENGNYIAGTRISRLTVSPITILFGNTTKYIRFFLYDSPECPLDAAAGLMLNLGSTALPYEPYGYKIPLTCAGQTVPVYLGQVSTVRRVKKYEFTGEEDFKLASASYFYVQNIFTDYNSSLYGVTTSLFSHYEAVENSNNGNSLSNNQACLYAYNQTIQPYKEVYIKDTRFATAADFKSYLSQQYAAGTPVVIWYVLAEPETAIVNEPLAKIGDYADELSSTDAGVTITTTEGQNTLTVDTDLQPSEMTITYKKEGQ